MAPRTSLSSNAEGGFLGSVTRKDNFDYRIAKRYYQCFFRGASPQAQFRVSLWKADERGCGDSMSLWACMMSYFCGLCVCPIHGGGLGRV